MAGLSLGKIKYHGLLRKTEIKKCIGVKETYIIIDWSSGKDGKIEPLQDCFGEAQ